MEKEDGGGSSSSKSTGDVDEQGESIAERIKCTIEKAVFCCDVCTKPFSPLIFQVNSSHPFYKKDRFSLLMDQHACQWLGVPSKQ